MEGSLSGGKLLTVNAGMSANKLLSMFVKYSMHVSSSARSKKQAVGAHLFSCASVFSHLIVHVFPSVCECVYARVSKRMEIFLHLEKQLPGATFGHFSSFKPGRRRDKGSEQLPQEGSLILPRNDGGYGGFNFSSALRKAALARLHTFVPRMAGNQGLRPKV